MSKEETILQEYILYVQHKENFVERSFAANRFYLVVSLLLLIIMVSTAFIPFGSSIIFTSLFCFVGIALCILWLMNIDSYKKLLKIKFQNVIERLEDELPVKPYQMEAQALREAAAKKNIVFAEMQKILAFASLLTFLTVFLHEFLLVAFF